MIKKNLYFVSFVPGSCGNFIGMLLYNIFNDQTIYNISPVADGHCFNFLQNGIYKDNYYNGKFVDLIKLDFNFIFNNLNQLILAGKLPLYQDKNIYDELHSKFNFYLIEINFDYELDITQIALQYIIKNILNEYKLLQENKKTLHSKTDIEERFFIFREMINEPNLDVFNLDFEIISRAIGRIAGELIDQKKQEMEKKHLFNFSNSVIINFRDIYKNHNNIILALEEICGHNVKPSTYDLLNEYVLKTNNLNEWYLYDYINGQNVYCFLHHKYVRFPK